MNLVKSKQRVADHGEVFTPAWMVEATLALMCIYAIELLTDNIAEPYPGRCPGLA